MPNGEFNDLEMSLANVLLYERLPLDIMNYRTNTVIVPANRKITRQMIRNMAKQASELEIDPSPIRNRIRAIIIEHENKTQKI